MVCPRTTLPVPIDSRALPLRVAHGTGERDFHSSLRCNDLKLTGKIWMKSGFSDGNRDQRNPSRDVPPEQVFDAAEKEVSDEEVGKKASKDRDAGNEPLSMIRDILGTDLPWSRSKK